MAETEVKNKIVKKPSTIKARVLIDCALGACNSIIDIDQAKAKAVENEGLIDTNPAAVAAAGEK